MFKFCRKIRDLEKLLALRDSIYKPFVLKTLSLCSKANDNDHIHSTKLGDDHKVNKVKKDLSDERLKLLSNDELISIIRKQEAHKEQLKCILQKLRSPIDERSKKHSRWLNISSSHKRHILLKFCYLGWHYDGFAIQENTANTIENHLFHALIKAQLVEKRDSSSYHNCGRTDIGVSAFEQVISLDLRSKIKPEDQLTKTGVEEEIKYCELLNRVLPKQMRAISWMPLANPNYSSRFDCIGRTYKYFFPRGNLNIDKMREACQFLVGFHDFRNLCKMDVANGVVNFMRTISSAEIKLSERNHDGVQSFDVFCFEITGISFLRQMIRAIVSVLMLVGKGKESPEIIRELMNVEAVPTKPDYAFSEPLPLSLIKCRFSDEVVADQSEPEILNKWVSTDSTLKDVIVDLQTQWCKEKMKSAMIYDILKVLQSEYSSQYPDQPAINRQAESLCQEIKASKQRKLLERQRGNSIENRVEHWVKKGRIVVLPLKNNKV